MAGGARVAWWLVLAGVSGGCVGTLGDLALKRASREFSCPVERIGIIQRADIDGGLFDIEACGQRARYSCFSGRHHMNHCTREPDPARWLPDPKEIAAFPPQHGFAAVRSTPGPALRVCPPTPPGVGTAQLPRCTTPAAHAWAGCDADGPVSCVPLSDLTENVR